MTKKYTLTTSEETVTENPEDIIRLMKLAGLTNAQPVAEEEVTEEVRDFANTPGGTSEEQLEFDPTDFEKKTGDNITKQNKSLDKAPSKGDNPLEYSLDENEIYEAMMKEFKELEESHGYLSDCCGAPADDEMDENNQAMCSNCKDYSSFSPMEESTEEVIEESKPDFLDLDKDGDKEESMKKAAKDKEKADESVKTENTMEQERLKKLSGINEDKSLTAGTIKKLQHLVNTQYDVYSPGSDIFMMFGSPYTADDWLSHMKITIDEVFTKEGSPVPPEVAKVYNDLEAYSKQTELQAKRRANTDKNASNAAPYYPENEDELYIRDNFAEQWNGAFYRLEDRLGLEYQEDFDESADMDRLKDLINYQN